ncbi:vWA domain-containing protein [Steroidobacter sp.]|uniref:vWA domain-containing protein n=1 Tax=Steroidobacter sp. TaxID=1978227 RepID=UPI001A539EE8|nr:VWA domain-containing protein [Steroidobacter sp.]MBL8266250.1 VWA domain-containing protein [Steroidobacter sp.]
MSTDESLSQLRDRWTAAWPKALAVWSRHVVLHAPSLCSDDGEAKKEGLTDSFAMIRLADQSIIINLADVDRHGLGDYAEEILAHEIGHHVLAPANLTDHARSLARIRQALPTLEAHAPMIANLFTDLLINDRLQRSAELRLADVFKKLTLDKQEASGTLWRIYLRTYELLWSLQRGSLVDGKLSAEADGDAWLAMRIVRHYSRDWIEGAAKFAMLMLPYLAKDALDASAARAWHDTRGAGAGGQPSGLAEADDVQPMVHPSRDPAITGYETSAPAPTTSTTPEQAARTMSSGQTRQPFEYGEILRAAGVTMSDHDIAVAYYREKAVPHLIRFPARRRPANLDPLPEGIEPWQMGESFDSIDWMQTIMQSPRVIPGMTTVQRVWGSSPGAEPASLPLNLDVFIDSSGSMPNPQQFLSFPTLAGAILCLSALRAGASVKVTVWSGKHQVTSTPGFVRDTQQVMRALISYYGGGTQFPLPELRQTYLETQRTLNPTHLLFISDDGITTVFDKDERGQEGWDLLRAALAKAAGGSTFVLAMRKDWETSQYSFPHRDLLIRARDELDVRISRIEDWEQLVAFARDFAASVYQQNDLPARVPA